VRSRKEEKLRKGSREEGEEEEEEEIEKSRYHNRS